MLASSQNPHESNALPGERALVRVADGLAHAIHTLLPGSTAAVVVVGHGSEWRMLGQRGPIDLSSTWRHAVARRVRDSDPRAADEYLIAPFSAVALEIMLVLAGPADGPDPDSIRVIVQPLLDAGGILLDRALATTRLDPPHRRNVEEELRLLTSWDGSDLDTG
jgi:hypothetical protein